MSGKPQALEGRFWERIQVTGKGCWEWQGWKAGKGYGGINYQGRKMYAHRLAWILRRGEIPTGLQVLHHCDNPPCINPDHLFLGTNTDNVHDCIAKGRKVVGDVRGEKNPKAVLSPVDVLRIRRLYDSGWKHEQIANAFCAPINAVRKAALRQTWRHIL
jgi:hypothetical protein